MTSRRQDRHDPAGDAGAAVRGLGERSLVVVLGKGGTGRSTLSAVLARSLAESGRDVTLIDPDPRESLHRFLGVAPSGGEPVPAGPRVTLQLADPVQIVTGLVTRHVPVGLIARRIVRSNAFRQIVDGAPGLAELALLARACGEDGTSPRGTVLLDAPATGHALALLDAPRLVAETIADGPIRALAARVASVVADPERTAFVVVAAPEELPVDETLELLGGLEERALPRPALVVVNGLYPEAAAEDHDADPDAARFVAARHASSARHAARLAASWQGELIRLPLVPADDEPALVAALGRHVRDAGR